MRKILMICLIAMMVLLSAFFVSNSMNGSEPTTVVRQKEKLVGLDINKNKYIEYETAFQDARSTGIDFTEITLSWDNMEPEQGVYNDDLLDVINIYYPSYDMKIALTFNLIDTIDLRLPEHLQGMELSDQALKQAFLDYLDHVLSVLDKVDIVAIAIGNEIDGYLKGEEWHAFESIFNDSKSVVRKHLPTSVYGTKIMFEGINLSEMTAFHEQSDVVMLTYYPIKDTLFVKSDEEIKSDLDTILAYKEDKPLYMMEVGMPTSSLLASSEAKQANFIELVFDYFRSHDHFELISVNWLNDRDELELMAFTEYYGLEDDKFYEYLSSLGLKDSKGNIKQGYRAFKDEVAKLNGEKDE